jgi:hypothetical protein
MSSVDINSDGSDEKRRVSIHQSPAIASDFGAVFPAVKFMRRLPTDIAERRETAPWFFSPPLLYQNPQGF